MTLPLKITVSEDGTSLTLETDKGDADGEDVGKMAKAMYEAVYGFNNPE